MSFPNTLDLPLPISSGISDFGELKNQHLGEQSRRNSQSPKKSKSSYQKGPQRKTGQVESITNSQINTP